MGEQLTSQNSEEERRKIRFKNFGLPAEGFGNQKELYYPDAIQHLIYVLQNNIKLTINQYRERERSYKSQPVRVYAKQIEPNLEEVSYKVFSDESVDMRLFTAKKLIPILREEIENDEDLKNLSDEVDKIEEEIKRLEQRK